MADRTASAHRERAEWRQLHDPNCKVDCAGLLRGARWMGDRCGRLGRSKALLGIRVMEPSSACNRWKITRRTKSPHPTGGNKMNKVNWIAVGVFGAIVLVALIVGLSLLGGGRGYGGWGMTLAPALRFGASAGVGPGMMGPGMTFAPALRSGASAGMGG